jgi:hypothetical protein
MARIFTTPDGERTAKACMHDIMVAAGLTKSLRTYTPRAFQDSQFITAAQTICNELTERDFANINPAIDRVSNYSFNTSYDKSGADKRLKADAVAKCIVYMAELLQLYWDDTIRTPFEIDEFKKTLLGSAVYKYGRYISAIKDRGAKTSAVKTGSTTKTPGQQPKNNYKQLGPLSGQVRDLQDTNGGPGTPGQKVHGSGGGTMFKIIGDIANSSNIANVFIKPLNPKGDVGGTNKIYISSGRGYGDCVCYFDDQREAQKFLDKLIADNRIPSDVSNMQVARLKEDPNGYFLVGTEYGTVAVNAKTLNEVLTEAVTEGRARTPDWKKATEGYTKEELNELHAWMRRD